MAKFSGFIAPQENWSKLPHHLIEAFPIIDSLGELKVILYILRHTWGYQDFEDGRRITLDEFENGVKRKNGDRIDGGLAMTRTSILSGLNKAVEHGFIEVEKNEKDKARVKKYYRLRQVDSNDDSGVQKLDPDVQNLDSSSTDSIPRSVKEISKDTKTKDSPFSNEKGGANRPATSGRKKKKNPDLPQGYEVLSPAQLCDRYLGIYWSRYYKHEKQINGGIEPAVNQGRFRQMHYDDMLAIAEHALNIQPNEFAAYLDYVIESDWYKTNQKLPTVKSLGARIPLYIQKLRDKIDEQINTPTKADDNASHDWSAFGDNETGD